MRFKSERIRLTTTLSPPHAQAPSVNPLLRVLSYLATALALVVALAFSAVVFALLLFVGALAGVWLWWKTRSLRRQMQDAAATMQTASAAQAYAEQQGGGEIIEGIGIRIDEDRPHS